MKKILFITPSLGGGGAERRTVNLSLLLKEKGYDVTVLGYTKINAYGTQLEDGGVHVVWRTGNYLQRLIRIPWFIIKHKFDVSISLLPTPGFLNCLAAMIFKGNRVIITGESSCNENKFTSRTERIFAWFQRFSDHLVCNSERAKEMWYKHYPKYSNKVRVIYNPVTIGKVSTEYIIRQDGITHFIVASSVYRTKNPLGLINAILLLKPDERAKIKIDWYGRKSTTKHDGGDYIKAVELIQAYNLTDILVFHDSISDINSKMNQADIVALFSIFEGLPNAICEGMMLSKPIIMTRMSDYDTLVDKTNGLLCDWDNPDSIKHALLEMAGKNNEELRSMGESSKKKAIRLFDGELIIAEWIKLLEKK